MSGLLELLEQRTRSIVTARAADHHRRVIEVGEVVGLYDMAATDAILRPYKVALAGPMKTPPPPEAVAVDFARDLLQAVLELPELTVEREAILPLLRPIALPVTPSGELATDVGRSSASPVDPDALDSGKGDDETYDFDEAPDEDDPEPSDPALPRWPRLTATGLRVVVVGGGRQNPAEVEHIRRDLPTLVWAAVSPGPSTASLVKSIGQRGVAAVLIAQFSFSHDSSSALRRACDLAGVPCIKIGRTSANAIRRGLDQAERRG